MRNKCIVFFGFLLLFVFAAPAALVFNMGTNWKYRKGTSEASSPVAAWRTNNFDDATWSDANAAFYYGEPLTGTQLGDMNGGYSCIFMRKTFNIVNPAEVTGMELRTLLDDGCIVWINGFEVLRTNMPLGTVAFNGAASAALDPELLVRIHPLPNPVQYLLAGQNTIAVQAFNSALSGSSDFVIDAQLLATIPDSVPPTVASTVPASGSVSSLSQITVNFNEPVEDVEVTDLLINGQPAVAMTKVSDSSYTFTFPQPPYGPVQISWVAAHDIRDYAAPPNGFNAATPGNTWQYTLVDTIAPVIVSRAPETNALVRTLGDISILFSEAVLNVDAADLLINGVVATNVEHLSPTQFLFQFAQPPTGAVSVAFAAGHGITDTANNPFGGGSWSYRLDTNAPVDVFIINEFMASNNTGIRDENGDYVDWVEIHNRGSAAGNLNGWFLTDDANNLTKWRFPNVGIAGNGYLLVYASGKDRTNNPARLHANFNLSAGGEYLALVDPRTNVVSSFNPIQQRTDVSYGRDRTDPNITGYFVVPTPGAANTVGGSGDFAPDVSFSVEEGTYRTNFSLTLSTPSPTAIIRYVLVTNSASAAATNVPSSLSPQFTSPIAISGTMQVRARAFETGKFPGTPVTKSYIQLNNNVVNFTSDLPLVIIHNFGRGSFSGGGGAEIDTISVVAIFDVDPETGRSSLTNKPQVITRAGINLRGSSTQGFPKSSYAVEFLNEFNDDKDVEVLGMPEESDWVFYSPNQFDISLIHNPLIYEISRDMGRWASRTRMVEVFVNVTGGAVTWPTPNTGNYNGIYVLAEKVKRNSSRVDIDRLQPENNNATNGLTGGYLFKIDRVDANERTFNAGGQGVIYQEPSTLGFGIPQWAPHEQYVQSYFNQFVAALASPNYTNPVTGFRAFVDVESWYDHNLLNVLTINVDALRLSAFFFKDRDKKLEMGPIWDFDRSAGTSRGDTRPWNPRSWLGIGADGGTDFFNNVARAGFSNPWYGRMFLDPDFFQGYIDRYQELRKTYFDTNYIAALIDRYGAELREAQAREEVRWIGSGSSDTSPRTGVQNFNGYSHTFPATRSFQAELDFQKRWFFDRINFMDTNFVLPPTLGVTGGLVGPGFEIALAAPTNEAGAQIYFTLDGTDPRLSGSGISPAAQLYTGPIAVTNNVRLFARARNPGHRNLCCGTPNLPQNSIWSGPVVETYYLNVPPLRLTEIMYHAADAPAGNTNASDNFEYVEVKNVGTTPLNLNRFRIRGGIDFDFGNIVLTAGQSAVVVANTNAFVSRYGAGRLIAGVYTGQLDNAGEGIRLEGPVREPIHDFEYDDAWYPITDGHGFSLVIRDDTAALDTWGLMASWRPSGLLNGSPAQNDPPQPNFPLVVINEVLTHSDPPPPTDTVELLNLSGTVANIGGWFLTDDFGDPKKYVITAGTTIDPNSFITFAENQFNVGANGFSFSSLGEEIYLFSGDGTNLTGYAHGFDFGAAPTFASFGRHVNSVGSEQFPLQRSMTLGAANAGPLVGPVVISEIMYHPPDTLRGTNRVNNVDDEYIELHNASDSPVALYDVAHPTNTWRLNDAVEFTFPPSVSIPARGYIIVAGIDVANIARLNAFRSRNGIPAAVPVYGPFSGSLDNTTEPVELMRPDSPEPAGPPNFGLVPYILVERVRYSDLPPWPIAADGFGPSLQRINVGTYGNDPGNWVAAARTPGAAYGGGVAPVVTTQPTNTTIVAFNNASFTVAASGANLSYQWRFNGNTIVGGTNATLTLTNVQPSQEGLYQALVLNPSGSVASSNAFLRVLIPARIIAQPVSLVFSNGSTDEATYGQTFSNATFAVSATSSTPLSYQWRYNGVPIAGATSHTLVVSNVDLTHQGLYDVVVTDGVGDVLSLPARLTVAVRPFITRHPQPIHALVGEDVTFSVDHRGTTPFGYRWRRSGVQVIPFPGSRVYTIPNVQSNHAGTYSVIITNLAFSAPGVLSGSALLTVLGDADGDKAPDAWETQFGFNPNLASDGGLDSDGDGMSNADEYRAGTDPTDDESYLAVDTFSVGSPATLSFYAISNRSYVVEFNDELDPGTWARLTVVPAPPTSGVHTVTDPAASPSRYYRLGTPMTQD
jgi:hypothetical protein